MLQPLRHCWPPQFIKGAVKVKDEVKRPVVTVEEVQRSSCFELHKPDSDEEWWEESPTPEFISIFQRVKHGDGNIMLWDAFLPENQGSWLLSMWKWLKWSLIYLEKEWLEEIQRNCLDQNVFISLNGLLNNPDQNLFRNLGASSQTYGVRLSKSCF